jgi:hypothetical protein
MLVALDLAGQYSIGYGTIRGQHKLALQRLTLIARESPQRRGRILAELLDQSGVNTNTIRAIAPGLFGPHQHV